MWLQARQGGLVAQAPAQGMLEDFHEPEVRLCQAKHNQ
jgi:hypothetical protein